MKEKKEKVINICKVPQHHFYKIYTVRPKGFKFLQQLVRKQSISLKSLAKGLFGVHTRKYHKSESEKVEGKKEIKKFHFL